MPTETTVDGRPVRSLTAGRLQALPEIVLLPGLGAPGYLAPWALETGSWTRATVLDVPGWRRGKARSCRPTLDDVAATTAGWLEVTDRRGVVLLGHSTGAQAVLRAALLVPQRLTGVVLAGPTFDPAARRLTTLLHRAVTTLVHEAAAELPAVVPSYLHSGGVPLLRFLLTALLLRPCAGSRRRASEFRLRLDEQHQRCSSWWRRFSDRIDRVGCGRKDPGHLSPDPPRRFVSCTGCRE